MSGRAWRFFTRKATSRVGAWRRPEPGALLVGEDPRTAGFDEAVHWIQVYGQLAGLETVLLERMDQLLPAVTDDAMREARLYRSFVRDRYARFRRRLEYWVLRAGDLTTPYRPEAEKT